MSEESTAGESASIDQELARMAVGIDIPPCPAILLELSAETKKDHPDFDKMEQLIQKDIGLSATLLKTVNSPFYGLRSKIGSVKQAIGLLGLSMITTTVYGLVIRNSFPDGNREFMEKFWDQSAREAMACSFMAGRIGGINREDAYTFGLFVNSGIPVLMKKYPDYKESYEAAVSSTDKKFTEIEDDVHGIDHATIGCMLTRSWNLPDCISSAVRVHHEFSLLDNPSAKLSPDCQNFVALGLLAAQINYNTNSGFERSMWLDAALNHLNISELDYQDLLDDALNLMS